MLLNLFFIFNLCTIYNLAAEKNLADSPQTGTSKDTNTTNTPPAADPSSKNSDAAKDEPRDASKDGGTSANTQANTGMQVVPLSRVKGIKYAHTPGLYTNHHPKYHQQRLYRTPYRIPSPYHNLNHTRANQAQGYAVPIYHQPYFK